MGGDKQPRANNKFFRRLNRFSFSFIEGKIDFHEKHNSTYDDNEILQTLLFLSIKNRYPENGCKRCKEIVEKSQMLTMTISFVLLLAKIGHANSNF